MPKKGNWGNWAVIDLPPVKIKKVSCYACTNYCDDDGSCVKTAIIPKIDGKDCWKKCKYFNLSPEYMTYSFIDTVKSVKGSDYFDIKPEDTINEKPVVEEKDPFVEKTNRVKNTLKSLSMGVTKIQFSVKSAKKLRNILGFYYGVRHYTGENPDAKTVTMGIIEEAISLVNDNLLLSFTSINLEEFAEELSKWFNENGLHDATPKNCMPYCIAMHSLALDFVLQGDEYAKINDKILMKKLVFLDSLTTILVDMNSISINKYNKLLEIKIQKRQSLPAK